MKLINIKSLHTVEAPTGFSWTTLFFGFFVPLLRGDMKGAVIQFMFAFFTGMMSMIIFPFLYNNQYIKNLREQGYVTEDELEAHYKDKAKKEVDEEMDRLIKMKMVEALCK